MSLLIAFPYETFEWTEEALKTLWRNKKLNKRLPDQLKKFASKFLKGINQDFNFN